MKPRDGLDRQILAHLEDNARISATELARRLGIARSTVNERIARLERDGIILGYSAIVRADPEHMRVSSMLFLECNRHQLSQITSALEGYPEIRHCVSISGPHNLACYAEAPSNEDLDALMDEIGAIDGVNSLNATIILATKFAQPASHPMSNMGNERDKKPVLRVV